MGTLFNPVHPPFLSPSFFPAWSIQWAKAWRGRRGRWPLWPWALGGLTAGRQGSSPELPASLITPFFQSKLNILYPFLTGSIALGHAGMAFRSYCRWTQHQDCRLAPKTLGQMCWKCEAGAQGLQACSRATPRGSGGRKVVSSWFHNILEGPANASTILGTSFWDGYRLRPGRTDAEAETSNLATWWDKLTHLKRPWC